MGTRHAPQAEQKQMLRQARKLIKDEKLTALKIIQSQSNFEGFHISFGGPDAPTHSWTFTKAWFALGYEVGIGLTPRYTR